MDGKRNWVGFEEGSVVEEERFEIEGRCELYVEIYVNHMVKATAR